MPKLVPVDSNPFEQSGTKLTPVEGNPFTQQAGPDLGTGLLPDPAPPAPATATDTQPIKTTGFGAFDPAVTSEAQRLKALNPWADDATLTELAKQHVAQPQPAPLTKEQAISQRVRNYMQAGSSEAQAQQGTRFDLSLEKKFNDRHDQIYTPVRGDMAALDHKSASDEQAQLVDSNANQNKSFWGDVPDGTVLSYLIDKATGSKRDRGDFGTAMNIGVTVDIPEQAAGITKMLMGLAGKIGEKDNPIRDWINTKTDEAMSALQKRRNRLSTQYTDETNVSAQKHYFQDEATWKNLSADGIANVPRKAALLALDGKLFGEGWSDPRKVAISAIESAPSSALAMIPVGKIAGTVADVAGSRAFNAAVAQGATEEAARAAAQQASIAAAKNAAMVAGGASEGIQGAGAQYTQTYDEVMGMSLEKLQQHPEFKKAYDETPDTLPNDVRLMKAKQAIADKAATYAGMIAGAFDSIFGALGDRYIGGAVAGEGSRIGSMAKGVAEELPTETIQSGGEQYGTNVGIKKYADSSRESMAGVGEEAVGGGLSGGLMGAGMGGAFHANAGHVENGDRERPDPNNTRLPRETGDVPAAHVLGQVEPEAAPAPSAQAPAAPPQDWRNIGAGAPSASMPDTFGRPAAQQDTGTLPVSPPGEPASVPAEEPANAPGAAPGAHGEGARYDFETTFPQPTESAQRELVADRDYADPSNPEAVKAYHEELVNELLNQQQVADMTGEAMKTGIDPRTGKQPKTEKARKNLAEELATDHFNAIDSINGYYSQYADIYGQDAAGQLRAHVDQIYQQAPITSEQPQGQESATPAAPQPDRAQPTASWVIRDKATGEAVMETFDKAKVDALNTDKYEAIPVQQHLAGLNEQQRQSTQNQPLTQENPATAANPAVNQPETADQARSPQARGTVIADDRLTGHADNLRALVDQAGWAEKGGRLVRDATTGEVTGRTSWVPKAPWFAGKPEGVTEKTIQSGVEKALNGEALTKKERDSVLFLLSVLDEQNAQPSKVDSVVDSLQDEEFADIPFDAAGESDVAAQMEMLGFSQEEIDRATTQEGSPAGQTAQPEPEGQAIGAQEGVGAAHDETAGHGEEHGRSAQSGGQTEEQPVAETPDHGLTSYTNKDILDREAKAAQAEKEASKEPPPKNVTADQADLFNTQGALFNGNREEPKAVDNKPEEVDKAIPWFKSLPGDHIGSGQYLVQRGIKTKKEAQRIADEVAGRVIDDGAHKFAVVTDGKNPSKLAQSSELNQKTIQSDTRLNDGEAEELLALAENKGGSATLKGEEPNAQPEHTPEQPHLQAGNGAEDRGNGADSQQHSGSVGGRLAQADEGHGQGRNPATGTAGASRAGGGNPVESQGGRSTEPSGGPRDSGVVRDRPAAPGAVTTPTDYVITDEDRLGEGGAKSKYRDNVAAIRVIKTLEEEGRRATPEEQRVLARYVGWGGIKGAFDPANKEWSKEHAELKELLTPDEYEAARRTILDAHYTSVPVVRGIFGILSRLGFKYGKILEPSMGTGNFIGLMPTEIRANSSIFGVELDKITGQIARQLYQSAEIATPRGFQEVSLRNGEFDLAIGNPPFGQQSIYDSEHKDISKFSLHNFFFAKSIEKLREGGIMGMVVSRYFMDQHDSTARRWIADRADLIGAVRLPYTAFKQNAGTEVVTDIVFFKKRAAGEKAADSAWVESAPMDIEGEQISVNRYFHDHPGMILGDLSLTGSMYAKNELNVEPHEGETIEEGLAKVAQFFPEGIYQQGAHKIEELTAVDGLVPEHVKVGGYFVNADGTLARRAPDSSATDEHGNPKRQMIPVEGLKEMTAARIKGMVKVRDALRSLMRAELSDTATDKLTSLRATLNREYDAFQRKYGYINSLANRRAFQEDPDLPLLESLEPKYDPGISREVAKKRGVEQKAPSAGKADIFTKRVLEPYTRATKAETAKDALLASLNEQGRVDMDYMAGLYGQDADTIAAELKGLVFKNPQGDWEVADEYLTGNVKSKLKIAEEMAQHDPRYHENVEALRKVQPADIEPMDISVRIGSPWLPHDVVEAFAKDLLGGTANAYYNAAMARWNFSMPRSNETAYTATYGTQRVPANEIIGHLLNMKSIVVKDNHGTSQEPIWVVNDAETRAANAKALEVAQKFKDWVWQDQARRERLAKIYNDTMNTNRRREFDGSHLTLPGASPTTKLRPHQKNAVWRTLQDRTVLLDHVVGAGKTYEMIASAMEMRRLGVAKKPIFVVPNHLVRQWRDEFYKLYPNANILATTEKDFEKANRQRLFARIATGDWDSVIIAHSSFKKIGMPPEAEKAVLNETMNDIANSIEDLKRERGDRNVIKDMERIKQNLEAKLKRLNDRAGDKDKTVTFDELGGDALFVDEAHAFKNLFYTTQMNGVAGLGNPAGSGRAFDLFVKARYLANRYAERAPLVFATGTPVSNSLVEMFTMQRYLSYDDLKRRGIHLLDAWAQTFGDVQQVYEVHPSGSGYRLATRFAKFVNMPELMTLYRRFADVITLDDLQAQARARGERFPVPKVKGGKPNNIVAERSDMQRHFFGVQEFQKDRNGLVQFETGKDGKPDLIRPKVQYNEGSILWKFENLRELTKKTDGKINALSITNEARKAGLDFRLIDPNAPDFEGSKINLSIKEIKRIYDKWAEDKGTQLVFCDLSVPSSARDKIKKQAEAQAAKEAKDDDVDTETAAGDESTPEEEDSNAVSMDQLMALSSKFSVYDDVKEKLIAAGIPANEIAFIHDYDTAAKKAELYRKVNAGEVRVLLGSTEKMGAGMNVQERLVGLHHLDAPWRPSDLEQREGRIIRQGNKLYERDPEGFNVEILRYATKQTYDTRMWQIIEHKAKGVEQLRHADETSRTIDDISGEAASAADMKAAASGNPLILEEIKLRNEIATLEAEESNHNRNKFDLQRKITQLEKADDRVAAVKREVQPWIETRDKHPAEPFKLMAEGKTFTTKDQIATPLTNMLKETIGGRVLVPGEYRGFKFVFTKYRDSVMAQIALHDDAGQWHPFAEYGEKDKFSPSGFITRMDNYLSTLEGRIKEAERYADEDKKELPKARAEADKPFAKKAQLDAARRQHQEVVQKLQEAGGAIELTEKMKRELVEAKLAHARGNLTGEDNSAKFSRADLGEGMTLRDLDAHITNLTRDYKNLPPIIPLQSVSDAPNDVQEAIDHGGARDDVEGLYYNGKIYLFADHLDAARAEHVLLSHELAHYGLRGLFGAALDPVLHGIWASNLKVQTKAAALKTKYGIKDNVTATEEVLADMREADLAKLKGWQKLVFAVRDWLRGHGFTAIADAIDRSLAKALGQAKADIEVARIVRAARAYAKNGRPATGTLAGVRFGKDISIADVVAAWRAIGNDLDAYKNPPLIHFDMQEIAREIDPKMRVEEDVPEADEPDIVKKWYVTMPDGSHAYIYENDQGKVWLDASRLTEGASGGTKLYLLVGTYAEGNGKVFTGDPQGLSDIALIRRTENMLSLALRYGSTDFLEPHPNQEKPGSKFESVLGNKVKPINWKAGEDDHNLGELIRASYANTIALAPEIKGVTYNFEKQRFERNGREFTDKDFDLLSRDISGSYRKGGLRGVLERASRAALDGVQGGVAGTGVIAAKDEPGREAAGSAKPAETGNADHDTANGRVAESPAAGQSGRLIGSATLKRAAITNTLARAARSGAGGDVLAALGGVLRGGLKGTPLQGILYSRKGQSDEVSMSDLKPEALLRKPKKAAMEQDSSVFDHLLGGKILFQKTGAARLWSHSVDKLLSSAGELVPEHVKAGIMSEYGLDQDYKDRKADMRAAEAAQARKNAGLVEMLAGLSRAESRIAYLWAQEKPGTREEAALMASLPEDSRATLQHLKQLITDLGREAVKLGQLSPDSFQRNSMAYLHRTYSKYVLSEQSWVGKMLRSRTIRVLGDQYKGRGLFDEITMGQIAKASPDWWGRRNERGHADTSLLGEKFIRFERRDASAEAMEPLPGMTAKPLGKLRDVAYWPASEPVPARFGNWVNAGEWEARKISGDAVTMWRDMTAQERARLGELDEVRYAMAVTLQKMVHDVEIGRFLSWVAKEYGETAPKGPEAEAREGLMHSYAPGTWVQVPKASVEGTQGLVKKYGALAGMWVPGPVWNDIRQMTAVRVRPWGKTYADVLQFWKKAKTAWTPSVHMNNVMANFVMADWHDMRAADLYDALKVLVHRGEPGYKALYERFQDSGATGGMFVGHELQTEQIKKYLDELRQELQQTEESAGTMAKVLHLVGMLTKPVKAAGSKMADVYGQEDEFFRLAVFLKALRYGKNDREAGRLARSAFLNYDINAPWVQAARQTILPFTSFTYRALPMLVDTVKNKPWKVLKLVMFVQLVNALGYALAGGGGDEDKDRRLMPDDKSGRVWGLVPKMVRMPWNLGNDPVFLDIRRWVPVGDIVDMDMGSGMLPPAITPSGPAMLAVEALLANKNFFTEREIVNDTDTAGEAAMKRLDHLFKGMLPNVPVPNPIGWVLSKEPGQLQTYSWASIEKAATQKENAIGEVRTLPMAALNTIGVKIGAYPSANMTAAIGADVRKSTDEIRKQIATIRRDYARIENPTPSDRKEMEARMQEQTDKLKRVVDKAREKISP